MLKSLVPKLSCPTCRDQSRPLTVHAFEDGADGHLREGALACEVCHALYPVSGDLLQFVRAELLDPAETERFLSINTGRLEEAGLSLPAPAASNARVFGAQFKQREHFDWFADNEKQTYLEFEDMPFWKAVNNTAFGKWNKSIRPGDWVVDVGSASGRSAFPLAVTGANVVGFDISGKMVRTCVERARAEGTSARMTFMVADGLFLPFRNDSMDTVVTNGTLHHLPDPGGLCRDAWRVVRPGGAIFGSEVNKSIFRSIFDLLMRFRLLWREEAGEFHLISRAMIQDWMAGLPMRFSSRTSVFLPPHLLDPLGESLATKALAATDSFFALIPGWRNHGGLIVFEMYKQS